MIALKMDDSRDTIFGSVCLRVAVLAGGITSLGVAYIVPRSRIGTRNYQCDRVLCERNVFCLAKESVFRHRRSPAFPEPRICCVWEK